MGIKSIIGVTIFILGLTPLSVMAAKDPSKSTQGIIISYHPLATTAGNEILHQGGNAFDAFIATTAAQYVLTEGVTSAAGPLGALLYSAKTHETIYLDGYFNNPMDPKGKWTTSDPKIGKAIPVPGAMKALEALSKKYGRLSFADCLKPAIALATNGFKVSPLYAALLHYQPDNLKRTAYGRETFFPNSRALVAGDELRLPEVARFFRQVAKHGTDYIYKGAWGRKFVRVVRKHGGNMTLEDLARYQIRWQKPLSSEYRGYEIVTTGGRTYGGLWSLLALKVAEHWRPSNQNHYSASADDLEILVRISQEIDSESWIYQMKNLDDLTLMNSRLNQEYARQIWEKVRLKLAPANGSGFHQGSHSYHVIAADAEGNVITGTNTINSFPWGDGLFVEGIPLPNSGSIANETIYGEPGGRRISPLSMHLVFKNQKLKFATGAFGGSLIPAEFQFLINLIDYGLSAKDTVTQPRFGSSSPIDPADLTKGLLTYLSPRVGGDIVKILATRGLQFQQQVANPPGAHIDTGYGNALILREDGGFDGAFAPLGGD